MHCLLLLGARSGHMTYSSHPAASCSIAAVRPRLLSAINCKKRSPPVIPLRDNRLPTMRTVFQYESRYWREILVCTLDTGRLMDGPFNLFPDSI